jgi:hypothetical protein
VLSLHILYSALPWMHTYMHATPYHVRTLRRYDLVDNHTKFNMTYMAVDVGQSGAVLKRARSCLSCGACQLGRFTLCNRNTPTDVARYGSFHNGSLPRGAVEARVFVTRAASQLLASFPVASTILAHQFVTAVNPATGAVGLATVIRPLNRAVAGSNTNTMQMWLSFHGSLETVGDTAYFNKKLSVSVAVAPESIISALRATDGSESVTTTTCGRLSIPAAAVAPPSPVDDEDIENDEGELDAGAMHTNGGPLGADVDPGDMSVEDRQLYRAAILSAATVRAAEAAAVAVLASVDPEVSIDPEVSAHPPDDGCAANDDADRAVAAALRATTTDNDDEWLIERFNDISFCRALGCHVVNVKWVNHGVESNTNEPEWGSSSPYLRESFNSSEWRERLLQLCDDGAPEVRPLRHCGKCTRVVWPNAHTDADVWVQQLMVDSAAHRQALDAAVDQGGCREARGDA